jgi:hypothetical protein
MHGPHWTSHRALCLPRRQSRSTGADNHGVQWGKAAVEMALLRLSAVGPSSKKFFMGFGDSAGGVRRSAHPRDCPSRNTKQEQISKKRQKRNHYGIRFNQISRSGCCCWKLARPRCARVCGSASEARREIFCCIRDASVHAAQHSRTVLFESDTLLPPPPSPICPAQSHGSPPRGASRSSASASRHYAMLFHAHTSMYTHRDAQAWMPAAHTLRRIGEPL